MASARTVSTRPSSVTDECEHEPARPITLESFGWVATQLVNCSRCDRLLDYRVRPVEDVEAPDLL